VIAGGVFDVTDPHEPSFELTIIVTSVLDAIDSFNSGQNSRIKKIAFWSDDLCVPRMSPVDAGRIIKSSYDGRYGIET